MNKVFRKAASKIGGYDIFISYRHADAEGYAKQLHKNLEDRGLIVFRDESEEDNPGTSTDDFARLACKARCLVTIVTPGVFQSGNVYDELSAYLKYRMDRWYKRAFSRIISINVDQALSKRPDHPPDWKRLTDFVYEMETTEAVYDAIPAKEIIERIAGASSFMKAWLRSLLVLLTVSIIVLAVVAGSLLSLKKISSNLSKEKVATAKLAIYNDSLSKVNIRLAGHADTLQTVSDKLGQDSLALTKRVNDLHVQSEMLKIRNASMSAVDKDPVMAYRLAEQAFKLSPDHENRKAIMASASKIGLYYTYRIPDYMVLDIKEPYALLASTAADSIHIKFSVLDTRTHSICPLALRADRGWLIPYRGSWRILSEEKPRDAKYADYRLWDNKGRLLGKSVRSREKTEVQFINGHRVRIYLYRQAASMVWDLETNSKESITLDTSIYKRWNHSSPEGPMATRADGTAALWYDRGLVLIDNQGKIMKDTYTESNLTGRFFDCGWSKDGAFLAVTGDYGVLLLWDPLTRRMRQISPKGMDVDAFAWSQTGHKLAFAGHADNDPDGKVEITDAEARDTAREIYDGTRPYRTLAFLPGAERLILWDQRGELSLVELSTGKSLARGFQDSEYDAINIWGDIYCTGNAIYCVNADEFRIWSPDPAYSANWFFKSDNDLQYNHSCAGDPSWHWLAIVLRKEVVLLRDIRTAVEKNLPLPRYEGFVNDPVSEGLRFSDDGKWLMMEMRHDLRIWNLKSGKFYDFPPLANGEFWEKLLSWGPSIQVKTDWKDTKDSSGKHHINAYVIQLDPEPRIIRKIYQKPDDENADDGDEELWAKDVDGWDVPNQYRYRMSTGGSIPRSGWAFFSVCEGSLYGTNCQLQFIPRNLEKLMDLYGPMMWKPSAGELKKYY